MSLSFLINIYLLETSLNVNLQGDIVDGDEFYFYLIKEGQVKSREGWFKKPIYQWINIQPGRYCVRCFIKRGDLKVDRFSSPVHVEDFTIRTLIDNCTENVGEIIPKLPFSQSS